MPYPGFHSCRLVSPGLFQKESFRNIKSGQGENRVQLIIARRKGTTKTSTQAIRYPVEVWRESRARAHCKDHGGTFEPAK